MTDPKPLRVYGLLTDRQGCGYYRIALPLNHLPRPEFSTQGDIEISDRWWEVTDIVVGQRLATDTNVEKWRRICADPDVRTVYDIDDDLWKLHKSNPAYPFYSRPEIQRNISTAASLADLVTVSTHQLAERMWPINPNVIVLPNCVDAAALDQPRPESGTNTVIIGWAGTPTHAPDWKVCATAIRNVITAHPAARMTFIGAAYSNGLPREKVTCIPWQTEILRYYDQLRATFDIGLAPLEDTLFNRAKSAVKVLEYESAGIPVIASRVGPYADYVKHGETGYLAATPDEWERYLTLLIDDRDMRIEMGDAGRKHVEDRTIQNNIDRWADAYRSLR